MLSVCAEVASAQPHQEITYLGTFGCGEVLRAIQQDDRIKLNYYGMWVAGYLSGNASARSENYLRGINIESIDSWIYKYCRENPLDPLIKASSLLASELSAKINTRPAWKR